MQTPFPLDTDFVFDMTNEIAGLNANGGTNTEDALGQAANLPWEPGQLALPPNERTRQVVILFSDGNPGAFRAQFRYNGSNVDRVGVLGGSPPTIVYSGYLGDPNAQNSWLVSNWPNPGHGDGNPGGCGGGVERAQWLIFQDPIYGINAYGSPMDGYSVNDCNINQSDWDDYGQWLVRQMAIDHATDMKTNMGIEIYTIGLGDIDPAFLTTLATDTDHTFFANDPSELEGIFQEIANRLKLILVS